MAGRTGASVPERSEGTPARPASTQVPIPNEYPRQARRFSRERSGHGVAGSRENTQHQCRNEVREPPARPSSTRVPTPDEHPRQPRRFSRERSGRGVAGSRENTQHQCRNEVREPPARPSSTPGSHPGRTPAAAPAVFEGTVGPRGRRVEGEHAASVPERSEGTPCTAREHPGSHPAPTPAAPRRFSRERSGHEDRALVTPSLRSGSDDP